MWLPDQLDALAASAVTTTAVVVAVTAAAAEKKQNDNNAGTSGTAIAKVEQSVSAALCC